MALRLAVLKNVFNSYDTRAYSLIFLFIAIIYLVLKNKKCERNLLIYEIFGILLLVTPFIGNKIITLGAGNESNWPVYGILCAIPLTAYVAADVLTNAKGKRERYGYIAAFLLVLQLGLGLSVTGIQFGMPRNLQKTSNVTRQILTQLELEEDLHIMAPIQVAGEIRECEEEIRVFYNTGYEEMQKDLRLLQGEASYYGCNCIILEKPYDNEEIMRNGGYEKIASVESYMIYRRVDL